MENKQSKAVIYQSNGNDVKLSMEIVRNYLVKGNTAVTDREVVQFINLCRYRQLNPFLNDAYLVKYGDGPASLVTSKEAYFKIAESCPNYNGYTAGIITTDTDGAIHQREGAFLPDGERIVGGWAKVYRTDRCEPAYASVNFAEYSTGRSLWQQKPATMIRKVAIVQALREAFPIQLGAMYVAEEQRIDETQQQKPVDVWELQKEFQQRVNPDDAGWEPIDMSKVTVVDCTKQYKQQPQPEEQQQSQQQQQQ